MASEDRNIMTIRLPPDQMRRLDRAANRRRQSKQSFVQEVTMAAVTDLEDRLKKPPIGNEQEKISTPETNSGGLGLVSAMQQKHRESSEPIAIAPTAPVVVQVGTNGNGTVSSSTAHSDLDRMALYVIKGDDFLRDARKRTAIEMLRASAGTDEEFNVLVAQLEQVVAVKTKVVEENSGVNKLARFAFDKLSELLRGE